MSRASHQDWRLILARAIVALGVAASPAFAQESDVQAPPPSDVPELPPPPPGSEATPTATEPITNYVPYGLPAPGTDVNANLPSSSRPITAGATSGDSFDLATGPSEAMKGNAGAEPIVKRSQGVPATHTVKKGDTLWDLCDRYYRDPWKWPEVWSYNPQLQNPHWIYPGDQVRMRRPGASPYGLTEGGSGLGGPGGIPGGTILLRNQGYIGDPKNDTWGMLVGGHEDQMIFADGNHVYMILRPGVRVQKDQQLTVFRRSRKPRKVRGARQPAGEIVEVLGTVRVQSFDPETRVARGQLTESLNLIERGASVGPVGRRFNLTAPERSRVDLWATVLDSFYPNVYYGRYQLAFIDKGSEDGLSPGNRLFAIRRGDQWRKSMTVSRRVGKRRLLLDTPEWVRHEPIPFEGDEKDFPEEIVGELRVIQTQKYTSLCVIIESSLEMEIGEKLVARKGF